MRSFSLSIDKGTNLLAFILINLKCCSSKGQACPYSHYSDFITQLGLAES